MWHLDTAACDSAPGLCVQAGFNQMTAMQQDSYLNSLVAYENHNARAYGAPNPPAYPPNEYNGSNQAQWQEYSWRQQYGHQDFTGYNADGTYTASYGTARPVAYPPPPAGGGGGMESSSYVAAPSQEELKGLYGDAGRSQAPAGISYSEQLLPVGTGQVVAGAYGREAGAGGVGGYGAGSWQSWGRSGGALLQFLWQYQGHAPCQR
jgi:hypothetical protein